VRDKPGRESPDNRRPSTLKGKANACGEVKGICSRTEPGVRPVACGERWEMLDLKSVRSHGAPSVVSVFKLGETGKNA
jgi:hypothetical protein